MPKITFLFVCIFLNISLSCLGAAADTMEHDPFALTPEEEIERQQNVSRGQTEEECILSSDDIVWCKRASDGAVVVIACAYSLWHPHHHRRVHALINPDGTTRYADQPFSPDFRFYHPWPPYVEDPKKQEQLVAIGKQLKELAPTVKPTAASITIKE